MVLHIPKTAGTAVASVLMQWFDVDEIMPTSLAQVRPGSHPANTLAARSYRLFGIGMLSDHDPVAAIRHALRGHASPFVFTVLREPKARLISQYHHWRRTDAASLAHVKPHIREAYEAARNLPLAEFLNTRLPIVIGHFRNYQTRLLAGMATSDLLTDEEILATARAHRAGYDLVGTTSQCDAAMEALAEAYGRTSPGTLRAVNVAPSRGNDRLDDATEAVIADYVALDTAIWQDLVDNERPVPQAAASCFYEAESGLQTCLVGNGISRFQMRQALDGSGWHGREGEHAEVRWTGPGRRSTIRLTAPRCRRLTVSIQLVCALDWAMADGLALTLDGIPPESPLRRGERGGYPTVEADFAFTEAASDRRELAIEVPFTASHAEINPDWGDGRQKGLAVGEIVVSARAAAPPATLGDLFETDKPWGMRPVSDLPALLRLAPDQPQAPPAERDLSFDLPLLASIIRLIETPLVMASSSYRSLARGALARARDGRLT
ncbi:MAG: hypothetical protein ACKOTB_07925, partial [Planctomycetia bacterium]